MKKVYFITTLVCMLMVSCKPEIEKPTVVTTFVGEITETTAKVVGDVTADGGAEVTSRGACWSTSQLPTIDDNKTIDGTGTGDYTSNISGLTANTTYYVRAYATNEAGTSYSEVISFNTEEENSYEYVDLGLPSGLKWAAYNIGASSPEEFGNYYAWGEIETKDKYSMSNSATFELTMDELQAQGYINEEGNLSSSYDVATVNWGGSWRMPTGAEIRELMDNCTWIWTTLKGVKGYNIEGSNGSSIFIPAAGYCVGGNVLNEGEFCNYWSYTPVVDSKHQSYALDYGEGFKEISEFVRYAGLSVRPVTE